MRTINKELRDYKWTFKDKQVSVTSKVTGQTVTLDKVGFMSLSRFILRSLDTMRIDGIKALKKDLNNAKEKERQIKEALKTEKANQKKLKKESRHPVGDTSQADSGGQV